MLLNDSIVVTEEAEEICSSNALLNKFSGLLLQLFNFFLNHSKPVNIANGTFSDFSCLLTFKLLEGTTTLQKHFSHKFL